MDAFEVSEDRWPIVIVRFVGKPTDDDYRLLFATFDAIYQREQPFITIVDASTFTLPSPKQMSMSIAWRITRRATVKRYGIAIVFVVRSIMASVSLQTLNKVSPMPIVTRAFISFEAALLWSENMLAAMGQSPRKPV